MNERELIDFDGKSILIVVAHPDDETLYFFAGLQKLACRSQVTVLCATYSPESERGMEFQAVCNSIGVKSAFLQMVDHGFDTFLGFSNSIFHEYLEGHKYDLIISHPPHGGEKPHPHHIGLFLELYLQCRARGLRFGCFSESSSFFIQVQQDSRTHMLALSRMVVFLLKLLRNVAWRHRIYAFKRVAVSIVKLIRYEWQNPQLFEKVTFRCCPSEKAVHLAMYSSQSKVLQSYRNSAAFVEFLFL